MSAPAAAPLRILPGDAPEAEWLAARRLGIGASDVAAVVGVSPYAGPLHVWLDKLGQLPPVDSPAMEWGRRLESAVLGKFADQHPELTVTAKPGMFADPAAPWRMCTPDGIADDDDGPALIEVKTGMSYGDAEQWGTPGTDEIPLSYLCQVTYSCGLLGYRRWHLPVLLLDQRDYIEYTGEFAPDLYAQLTARVDAFWDGHVVPLVEPPADGFTDTTHILTRRYRDPDRDTATDLPADALQWAEVYRINHEAIAEREAAKREAGNLFRQALAAASAAVGTVDGVPVVTWRRPKPRTVDRFDLDAFRAAHPGLAAEFTTTETITAAPTLRVKGVSL